MSTLVVNVASDRTQPVTMLGGLVREFYLLGEFIAVLYSENERSDR